MCHKIFTYIIIYISIYSGVVLSCGKVTEHFIPSQDYQTILEKRDEGNNNPLIERNLKNDFMNSYPEGKQKELIINDIIKARIEGIFIKSIIYNKSENKIRIRVIAPGCARIGAYMRSFEHLSYLSEPYLVSISSEHNGFKLPLAILY